MSQENPPTPEQTERLKKAIDNLQRFGQLTPANIAKITEEILRENEATVEQLLVEFSPLKGTTSQGEYPPADSASPDQKQLREERRNRDDRISVMMYMHELAKSEKEKADLQEQVAELSLKLRRVKQILDEQP